MPRTTPVKRLFLTFKQKKVHMAIVVSEYGKVLGLVTMDDVLAQIFGVMRDERAGLQDALSAETVRVRSRTPAAAACRSAPTTGPLGVSKPVRLASEPGAPVGLVPPEALPIVPLDTDTGPVHMQDASGPVDADRRGRRRRPRARRVSPPPSADPHVRRRHAAGERHRRAREGRQELVIGTSALAAILVTCALAQAFFVAAEVALSACDRARLRGRASGGNLAAARAGAHARGAAGDARDDARRREPRDARRGHRGRARARDHVASSPLWAPLIAVPPLLVLGHLVPKALVQAHADRLVDPIARPLRLASFVLRPIVVVVGGYAALLTRVTKTERRKAFVTRDELAMLIESEPTTDKPEISARRARDDCERVRAVGVQDRRSDGAAVRGHRAARGRARSSKPRSRSRTSNTRACRSTARASTTSSASCTCSTSCRPPSRAGRRRARRSRRSRTRRSTCPRR